jgi:hypothetical protein
MTVACEQLAGVPASAGEHRTPSPSYGISHAGYSATMFKDDPRFAPWQDRAWDRWREVERDGEARVAFCAACGFAHRLNNHGPARESAE